MRQSRTSDPISSKLAEQKINKGKRQSDKIKVLKALSRYANITAAELAKKAKLDRYMCSRRLPDLEWDFKVKRRPTRNCRVTGNPSITWNITRQGKADV